MTNTQAKVEDNESQHEQRVRTRESMVSARIGKYFRSKEQRNKGRNCTRRGRPHPKLWSPFGAEVSLEKQTSQEGARASSQPIPHTCGSVLGVMMVYRGLVLGSSCSFQISPPTDRSQGLVGVGGVCSSLPGRESVLSKREHTGLNTQVFLLGHLRCWPLW